MSSRKDRGHNSEKLGFLTLPPLFRPNRLTIFVRQRRQLNAETQQSLHRISGGR